MIHNFLETLYEHGNVKMPSPEAVIEHNLDQLDAVLLDIDMRVRKDGPARLPNMSLPSARWGVVTLYTACQFMIYRDVPATAVVKSLQTKCPEPSSPGTVYSVDLGLRFLPEVYDYAHRLASADPLVNELLRLANEWPLSSVGIPGIESIDIESFADSEAMMQQYVDRIMQRRDRSRLTDARIARATRSVLGAYPELCPEMQRAVEALTA